MRLDFLAFFFSFLLLSPLNGSQGARLEVGLFLDQDAADCGFKIAADEFAARIQQASRNWRAVHFQKPSFAELRDRRLNLENAFSSWRLDGNYRKAAEEFEASGEFWTAAELYQRQPNPDLEAAARMYEASSQWLKAAQLYEKLGMFQPALDIYVKLKSSEVSRVKVLVELEARMEDALSLEPINAKFRTKVGRRGVANDCLNVGRYSWAARLFADSGFHLDAGNAYRKAAQYQYDEKSPNEWLRRAVKELEAHRPAEAALEALFVFYPDLSHYNALANKKNRVNIESHNDALRVLQAEKHRPALAADFVFKHADKFDVDQLIAAAETYARLGRHLQGGELLEHHLLLDGAQKYWARHGEKERRAWTFYRLVTLNKLDLLLSGMAYQYFEEAGLYREGAELLAHARRLELMSPQTAPLYTSADSSFFVASDYRSHRFYEASGQTIASLRALRKLSLTSRDEAQEKLKSEIKRLLEREKLQEAAWLMRELGMLAEAEQVETKLISLLQDATQIVDIKVQGGGSSASYLVTYSKGVQGIFKPDFEGQHRSAEIAAYQLSRELKVHRVPATTRVRIEGLEGSVQYHVNSARNSVRTLMPIPDDLSLFYALIGKPQDSGFLVWEGEAISHSHGMAFEENMRLSQPHINVVCHHPLMDRLDALGELGLREAVGLELASRGMDALLANLFSLQRLRKGACH